MNKANNDLLKKTYKKIPIIKTINGVDYLGGYIDREGIFHPIPLYEKIKVPSSKYNGEEIKLAEWWKREKGGDVALVPSIETQKGSKEISKVKTPDMLWNGERWDFKGIDGNTKNTIERKLSDYKKQTDNIILFARHTKLNNNDIKKYIENAYSYYIKNYDSIVYIRNYKIIKEYGKIKK